MNDTTDHRAAKPNVVAAVLSVIAAIGAAASVVLVEVLERHWDSLDCTDSGVEMLGKFQWAALILASIALLLGLVALLGRTARTSWLGIAGIVIALIVAALMFLPTLMPSAPDGLQDFGTFQCASSTP